MHWTNSTTPFLLLSGALLLAYEPVLWLLGSWYLPGYPRSGPIVFALVLLLFGYSVSSPPREGLRDGLSRGVEKGFRRGQSVGLGLLLFSACVRAAAQVADINLLGALVLAVDVYAIALLVGTGTRQRAIAPFWLAVVFCFCLPLEPWLQRLLGTPLQWLSAQGACGLLSLGVDDLICDGMRLSVHGVEVLVDLACSGSQLLVQASLLLALLFACAAPRPLTFVVGLLLSLVLVWLLNAVRITLLALGLVYQPWGLDVMTPSVHAAIGLLCFALLALAMLAWALTVQTPEKQTPLQPLVLVGPTKHGLVNRSRWTLATAVAFVLLALAIVQLDAQPMDRTATLASPYLPAVLAGQTRRSEALTEQEQTYYQTYGGAATKASYSGYGLLLVRTGAPIRHLHAPDICLGGMGFQVDLMGTDLSSVPTTVYRAQRKATGELWQVRVSYVADTGVIAASLSEVAWMWLRSPSTRWTMVQRLVPWSTAMAAIPGEPTSRIVPAGAAAWDNAVLRAFNLYTPQEPNQGSTPASFST